MAKTILKGITWRHRRAVDPLLGTLDAFCRANPDIDVAWDARPLHGFEFTPVAELAKRYDLIVLDHPFCGDIAASSCLLPVEDLLAPGEARAFVGPSLESYRYEDRLWALPLDAACQVAVYRPDLLARCGGAPPQTWDGVLALGDRAAGQGLRLAIALFGVHSLMTFFTLCANQGRPCATNPAMPLVDCDVAARALDAMRRLLAFCPPEVLDWNSIALHDRLAADDSLVYCPAVYCYAAYAEADMPRPLRFADLPGLGHASPAGSTVGGTGLGISARTAHADAARRYARYLVEIETQRGFAARHGQPARLEAWRDSVIDARFAGCFSATIATQSRAWVRPRYAGYLRFQAEAGGLVETHLRGGLGEAALLDRLGALHAARGCTA